MIALGHLVLVVDGLHGIALALQPAGDILLADFLARLAGALIERLPQLLVLGLGGGLHQLDLIFGKIVLSLFRQFALDDAKVDKLVDGGLNAGLAILVGHFLTAEQARQVQRGVQGALHYAQWVAELTHAHHNGVIPGRLRIGRQA